MVSFHGSIAWNRGSSCFLDAATPAFLQRLRGEVTGERKTASNQARPAGRAKHVTRDEDDGPTYVLEESNETLSKEEYEALVNGKSTDKSTEDGTPDAEKPGILPEDGEKDDQTAGTKSSKQQMTEAGTSQKKRKLARVVGGEDDDDAKNDLAGKKADTTKAKKKKKSKPIKLAFGDEEEAT
jgi:hypothetical protein